MATPYHGVKERLKADVGVRRTDGATEPSQPTLGRLRLALAR
jgi:hypothetical protein